MPTEEVGGGKTNVRAFQAQEIAVVKAHVREQSTFRKYGTVVQYEYSSS